MRSNESGVCREMKNLEAESHPAKNKEGEASAEIRDRRHRQFVAIGFFLFIIILWLAIHLFNRVITSRKPPAADQPRFKVVEIFPGSSVSDIARQLFTEDLITSEFAFKISAAARGSTRELKAGEYRLETSMSVLEVLSRLEQGRVMLHEFTIPEGYTLKQMARRLNKLGLVDETEFLDLANDPVFCKELGVERQNLEGFLFPDTYRIAKGLSAETVIHIMVDRFWSIYSDLIRQRTAAKKKDLHDIVNIASIIEKEALFDDEEPLVASVIHNRLRHGMPLQCDVTIRYPLDNYGIHLTYADLRMDSPYNSYLYPGLPPTPICSPGLSALRAALNPAESDYMYFVSMNNGRHKFSSSLSEHNGAVYKYQIRNERG